MNINAKTKVCCIIGDPVEHSLSPVVHNAGYEALGLNYVYVAFHVEKLKEAIDGLRAVGVRGIVVTVPHKIAVLQYVDEIDGTAQKIGAVNTIVNDGGVLKATNTDWIGAIKALRQATDISGKTVAVLGAGGASRAICYGLKKEGAHVLVFNRTIKTAETLVNHLMLEKAYKLDAYDEIARSDIVVNTTSVGLESDNLSPLPNGILKKHQVVFDIVYTPLKTKLLRQAKMAGAKLVFGDGMVLYGGVGQFELFTNYKAPIEIMKKTLYQLTRESN